MSETPGRSPLLYKEADPVEPCQDSSSALRAQGGGCGDMGATVKQHCACLLNVVIIITIGIINSRL